MKSRVPWENAKGIIMPIPEIGERRDKNNPFPEIALKCEQWLIAEKECVPRQLLEHELNKRLREEFFYAHIDNHPEWFSAKGVEKMDEITYRCRGCSSKLNPTTLWTCCNS